MCVKGGIKVGVIWDYLWNIFTRRNVSTKMGSRLNGGKGNVLYWKNNYCYYAVN